MYGSAGLGLLTWGSNPKPHQAEPLHPGPGRDPICKRDPNSGIWDKFPQEVRRVPGQGPGEARRTAETPLPLSVSHPRPSPRCQGLGERSAERPRLSLTLAGSVALQGLGRLGTIQEAPPLKLRAATVLEKGDLATGPQLQRRLCGPSLGLGSPPASWACVESLLKTRVRGQRLRAQE